MSNFTPAWFKKGFFNESLFCDDFLSSHQLLYSNGAFFTPDGRMVDPMPLRCEIFEMMREYVGANLAKKVTNVVDVLKLAAQVEDFPPVTDRIALANGTLYLDGTFQEGKPEIVRNRLPVKYDPKAAQPVHWLRFLSDLLYPEDIPTVQEFIGYCLIPSNKGQRMMVIKGNGGEGKSQIGVVLSRLFGCNMKDGSIGKISENRFARADLEHTLLCVDDDMRMEALRQTNYVKSIVTAQGQMDLERKGKQSYQGWMYARLLAFSNGDLQALYDRSDGFYRRQLILTTKDKPLSRVDDPDIAEKMAAEVEGILLWAFEGLQRLVKNGFQFTESDRAKRNRELVKRDNNNVFDFLESEGYIRLKADACTSSKELYEVYKMWCEENSLNAMRNEKEGILLWALEGLHRLIRNNYQFTISERTTANLKEAMEQGNNILGFLKSEGYFEIRQGAKCKSTDFYKVYERWCLDNLEKPLAASTFIHHLKDNQKSLGIVYDDKCIGTNRGFHNVDVDLFLPIDVPSPWD